MEAAGQGGFAFDLCKRNEFFEKKGVQPPGFTKTGTTIAGIIYDVRARAWWHWQPPDHSAATERRRAPTARCFQRLLPCSSGLQPPLYGSLTPPPSCCHVAETLLVSPLLLPACPPAPPDRPPRCPAPPRHALGCLQGGVVLGADTRSTAGTTVADKNCEKIHYIAPNIYCCGAGTAADTENVTGMVASQLELHRYATGTQSRVVTSMTLLKSHLFR